MKLKLPLHFPLYELDESGIHDPFNLVYSIAFDQAALMLDAYLGQGEVVRREMIPRHSQQLFQSEFESEEAFFSSLCQLDLSRLPNWDQQQLQSQAIANYNYRNPRNPVQATQPPQLLNRLALNYLRHQCTNYDWLCDLGFSNQVYAPINQAIAQKYPWLAAEALRQTEQRQTELVGKTNIL